MDRCETRVGGPEHSGKDSLNQALSFLRANPGFVKREILFLYDCDTKKPASDEGRLHVRTVDFNTSNNLVKIGIENLLPESAFSDDMFDVIKKIEPSGKSIEIRELNKMRLCERICKTAQAENFAGFKTTLKGIASAFICIGS